MNQFRSDSRKLRATDEMHGGIHAALVPHHGGFGGVAHGSQFEAGFRAERVEFKGFFQLRPGFERVGAAAGFEDALPGEQLAHQVGVERFQVFEMLHSAFLLEDLQQLVYGAAG